MRIVWCAGSSLLTQCCGRSTASAVSFPRARARGALSESASFLSRKGSGRPGDEGAEEADEDTAGRRSPTWSMRTRAIKEPAHHPARPRRSLMAAGAERGQRKAGLLSAGLQTAAHVIGAPLGVTSVSCASLFVLFFAEPRNGFSNSQHCLKVARKGVALSEHCGGGGRKRSTSRAPRCHKHGDYQQPARRPRKPGTAGPAAGCTAFCALSCRFLVETCMQATHKPPKRQSGRWPAAAWAARHARAPRSR